MPVLTGKHRAILRLMHYTRFMVLRRRFKRARMPYELDDAEAELCDLEHKRMRAFKQVNFVVLIQDCLNIYNLIDDLIWIFLVRKTVQRANW